MNDVFGNSAAGFVIFLLIVLVIVLLVSVVNMNMKMNRLQRRYNLFMKGSDGQSVEKVMSSRLRELGKLRSRQEKSREDLMDLQHQYNNMLCKYGIVKYDAFEDVGGKMSFALAMLDQNNTGFVLNAIHSRDNCYLYLKDVVKGTSYIMLSDEEIEALRRASRYGEAEVAAAATRRKKHDEERARREAAEEAKAEKRQAAQAAQRRKRAETPEEAELRMLEEIIANAENKSQGTPQTSSSARKAGRIQETVEMTRSSIRLEKSGATARPAETTEGVDTAVPTTDLVSQPISPAPDEGVTSRQERSAKDAEIVSDILRRTASARRIEEGMPELTE